MQSSCCRNENRCRAACFSQFCRKSPLVETPAVLGSEAPSCLPLCLQSKTVPNLPCAWHSRGLPEELRKGNPGEHSPGSPQQEQAVGCPREGWGQPHPHLGEHHADLKAFQPPFCFVTDCCLRAQPLQWSSAPPARCHNLRGAARGRFWGRFGGTGLSPPGGAARPCQIGAGWGARSACPRML